MAALEEVVFFMIFTPKVYLETVLCSDVSIVREYLARVYTKISITDSFLIDILASLLSTFVSVVQECR